MAADTTNRPDMAPGAVPGLAILDVRHAVEERHLRNWLQGESTGASATRPSICVSLPISSESRGLNLVRLSELLAGDASTPVVPVRVSWRNRDFEEARRTRLRHLLFGDSRSPGQLRAQWILWRDRRRGHCIAGKPSTIGELRTRFEEKGIVDNDNRATAFAEFVVRQAGVALDIAERELRGSRYKVPRFVAENLQSNPRFREAITALAQQGEASEEELTKEAEEYMDELISRPTPFFIDMKAGLERFMLSLGYERELSVDPQEVERFRQIIREKPTLVLFTHKTYLDGLAATDIAYRNDMPLIHTFGGINMAMPGLSTMMRGAGGIFIRRSFRDNPLYKLVLRHYISYLLEKRFPMTWAFEGTRSRIGKLMPPRFGLLKYVIDSAHSNDVADLHFLPVSTSFDLIRDVEDYVAEQAGRLKKPESLSWFLGYLRSLREPRGTIYVNFGEPVVVPQAPDPEDKLALAKIAFEVAVRANRVTPFTLNSLMCLILMGAAPRGMTASELLTGVLYFMEWGRQRGVRMAATLGGVAVTGIDGPVGTLLNSGLFIRYDQGSETVYAVEPTKHPVASYYRNTIIHHFLDRAIIELSLLKARELHRQPAVEVFWAETGRLRDLFKFEFFYPDKEEFRANLETELGRVDDDWREKLEQGGDRLHSLLNRFQPLIGHAVFLPLVEAYTVVLWIMNGLKPGEVIDEASCVSKAIKEGRFAYLLRRITSEASIAKTLFENGFKLIENMGLAGETTAETAAQRRVLLREFRDLSRRMEVSRIEGLRSADRVFDEGE